MHEKLEAMNDACSGNPARKSPLPPLESFPRMAAKASFPTPILKPPEMKSPICFQLAWPLNIQPSYADESAIILSEILFFYLTRL